MTNEMALCCLHPSSSSSLFFFVAERRYNASKKDSLSHPPLSPLLSPPRKTQGSEGDRGIFLFTERAESKMAHFPPPPLPYFLFLFSPAKFLANDIRQKCGNRGREREIKLSLGRKSKREEQAGFNLSLSSSFFLPFLVCLSSLCRQKARGEKRKEEKACLCHGEMEIHPVPAHLITHNYF